MAADNYLDSDDYDAHLGADVRASVEAAIGVDGLTLLATDATAFVQSTLRNSGYEIPTQATMLSVDGNRLVKLAVGAALRELASGIPDVSLPLPENWAKNIARVALDGILSGDTQLDLPQRTIDAPGGWSMSSTATNARPQRASRCQLLGY